MVDIQKLLSQMTLEEKIGQLTQYNADVFIQTDAQITGPRTKLGLTGEQTKTVGSALNFASAQQMRQLQDLHLAQDRNKIPMLFMMDVIHGYRTIYPIPLALGCSFDPELAKECSRMAAREASAGGVQLTFTPMVDFVRDARWGRVMETCGEDVLLNCRMGKAQVEAFQGDDLSKPENIATCVKHFAAYGGAEAGRDYNQVELSEHLLRERYLPAYKACLDGGATMVMPSFNVLNGVPAVANSWLMEEILRQEWGFDGVVISDYDAIGELLKHGVAQDGKEAAYLAFSNGCHIEMCSSTYFHHLPQLLAEGKIAEADIDRAVEKVLRLKQRLGLFEDPYHGAGREDAFLLPQSRELVRRAAQESAVLLKNEDVLPLGRDVKRIALIGPMADEQGILGFWSCNGRKEEAVTVYRGLQNLLPACQITLVRGCGNQWNDTDTAGFQEAVAAAAAADAVILCLGEPQDYSGEGNSRTELRLPGVQTQLANAVAAVNRQTVALTFSGRPLVLTELEVPAILHMWFPGTEGGNAAANLLFGLANPCGKLSMSFPKAVGQCPIYYDRTSTGRPKKGEEGGHEPYTSNYIDCGNLPLYSFGHGLSYASFVYEELTLSGDTLTPEGSLTARVRAKNNSALAGKETVMLYFRDPVASCARPVQQLLDFKKVSFQPWEEKTVEFTVTEPQLRFWNSRQEYRSEPGLFHLYTGCADRLLLQQSFTLCGHPG